MKVVVGGSSGLIGSALVTQLKQRNVEVVTLVRRPAKSTTEIQWDPTNGQLDASALEGVDAVVNLGGAGIGDKRWTNKYKQLLVDSRIDTTKLLAETIAKTNQPPQVFLSGSAIGFYGSTEDGPVDEAGPKGEGFLSDLTAKWEEATNAATAAGIRTVFLRTGIVLTPKGGALAKLLPLFKLFAGGKFGTGEQLMSWITLQDEVNAIIHLMESDLAGPVNLTAPHPCTNAHLTEALGAKLRRPTFMTVPKFGPRLLLGQELADALLFESQNVVPASLTKDGFEFSSKTIEEAFNELL